VPWHKAPEGEVRGSKNLLDPPPDTLLIGRARETECILLNHKEFLESLPYGAVPHKLIKLLDDDFLTLMFLKKKLYVDGFGNVSRARPMVKSAPDNPG
jgi:hypothetical protein